MADQIEQLLDTEEPRTPSADDLVLPGAVSLEDRDEIQQEIDENSRGIGELAVEAFKSDNLAVSAIHETVWGEEFAPDPDYAMSDEDFKRLSEDIPEDYWPSLLEAHSPAHAEYVRGQILRNLDVERELGNAGMTGFGLRLAAAVLDPVAWGAAVATDGLAAPAVAAVKGGRLARAASLAASGGVSSAAVEAALAERSPTITDQDVLFAALGGSIVGGAFGAATRSPFNRAANEQIDALLAEARDDVARSSVGAAQARAVSDEGTLRSDVEELLADAADAPRTAFASARIDAIGELKRSDNPFIRQFVSGEHGVRLGLAEDSVGNVDGRVNPFSASEWATLQSKRYHTRFQQAATPAYEEHAKRQGYNWWTKQRERKGFMEQVTRAVRDDSVYGVSSAEVQKAADGVRELFHDLLRVAQRPGEADGLVNLPGIRGFEEITPNRNYVPRIYSTRGIGEAIEKFGERNVVKLLADALRKNHPDIEDALAEKYAKWHLRNVRKYDAGLDTRSTRAFGGEDQDALWQILREDGDWSGEEIDALIEKLSPRSPGEGTIARGKKRFGIAEGHAIEVRTADGRLERLGVDDLLVNDMDHLFQIYSRQILGWSGMARAGIRGPSEWDQLIQRAHATAAEVKSGDPERDIENLNFLRSMITGDPYARNSGGKDLRYTRWGKAARLLRDYNFVRLMGQVGFAQIAEMGNIIGQLGMRTAIASIPGFKSFIRQAKTGKLADEQLAELEAIFGIGTDRYHGMVENRWDDFGTAYDPMEGKFFQRANEVLARGRRVTADVSGMAGVNMYLHRWSMSGIKHRIGDDALAIVEGRTPRNSLKRYAAEGLTEDDLRRIGEQIKKHATVEEGIFTKEYRLLNWDDWDDLEARARFQQAGFRLARRIIQENDPGNMHRWMSHPTAQLITQFRSFMMVAWNKQFLHGLNQRDFPTFASWISSMIAAGIVYVGQTNLNAIGREDREEYLKERLSAENIGKAAFQRAGFASLVPMGIDTLAPAFMDDPVFDFRTSGLASNGILGNPTTDFVDGLGTSLGALRAVYDPTEDFTQTDLRGAASLLPLQNAVGVRNVLNVLSKDLPARSAE